MKTQLLIALLLLTACTHNGTISPEAARIEANRATIPPPQPEPVRNVVPGDGDCAPKADNRTHFGSCCNDQACTGQCVQVAETKIECDCYGVRGGCEAGFVCCRNRRKCVPAEDCEGQ